VTESGRAILVIKLGALGDMVQALDAFHDIRAFHRDARIELLTTPPFAALGARMPWFDRIWLDGRIAVSHPLALLRFIARLRRARYARIYDLQCSERTGAYFRLLAGPHRPQWVGTAGGSDFPLPPQPPDRRHNADLMRAQLAAAGVPRAAPTDLGWFATDISAFALPARFVMLAPGSSPHLPHKRWPAESYAELARDFRRRGYHIVLVGTAADRAAIERIKAEMPEAIDLSGRTDLFALAAVARRASGVVGNDTGPIFLAAALGAPTLMLMSHHTDPARSAPRGPAAAWLKRDELATLPVAEVAKAALLREAIVVPATP
jgi:ADP-heptose:LPS heptosyltransferase